MRTLYLITVTACISAILISAAAIGLLFGSGGISVYVGQKWPAASTMKLVKVYSDGADGVLFDAEFYVLRPDECSFRSFDWRYGQRAGRNVPVEIRAGRPEVRKQGLNKGHGWHLPQIQPEQFYNTFADVLHDCGWPFLIRTRFWN